MPLLPLGVCATTSDIALETCATFTMCPQLYGNIPSECYPAQQGNFGLPRLPCPTLCHQVTLQTLVPTHVYRQYTKYTGLSSIWLPHGIPYGYESSPLQLPICRVVTDIKTTWAGTNIEDTFVSPYYSLQVLPHPG